MRILGILLSVSLASCVSGGKATAGFWGSGADGNDSVASKPGSSPDNPVTDGSLNWDDCAYYTIDADGDGYCSTRVLYICPDELDPVYNPYYICRQGEYEPDCFYICQGEEELIDCCDDARYDDDCAAVNPRFQIPYVNSGGEYRCRITG